MEKILISDKWSKIGRYSAPSYQHWKIKKWNEIKDIKFLSYRLIVMIY